MFIIDLVGTLFESDELPKAELEAIFFINKDAKKVLEFLNNNGEKFVFLIRGTSDQFKFFSIILEKFCLQNLVYKVISVNYKDHQMPLLKIKKRYSMTEKIRILSQREEDVTNAFNEGFDVFCIANEETITKYKNTPEFLLKTCTTGRIIPIGSFGSIADHNNFF